MKNISVFRAVSAAFFFVLSSAALAQNSGTVTNHALPIGKGPGTTGFGSLLLGSGQIAIGQTSADPTAVTPSGDVTIGTTGVTAIGANKVTNSQLNTMGANTTKCNATAGTANSTDCTAATMKTNLGLVIGTNVEAWDTDLDCLAALSSTGVIHRTGAGTCSAGSVALSDLVTGTQDTVLGYFGSTAASALAINNCSNALTYSTSTHTFGCNTTAGTGTVTTTGTPTAGQNAYFTGSTVIQGLTPASVQTASLSPTGTASTTSVMLGLGLTGCTITPTATGRVHFEIVGYASSTATSVVTASLRFGTGTAPANGVAASGTRIGAAVLSNQGVAAGRLPQTVAGIATGLTLGTPVWFDADLAAASGTATIVVGCNAYEF